MNDNRRFAAAAGFAFVAAWIGFGFGGALLCGLGAALGYAVLSVLEGDVDLGELQGRLAPERASPQSTTPGGQRRARVR